MKTKTLLVLLAALVMATACTKDAEPLTAEQKKDVEAMKLLMKECEANPPKEGTQAKANCVDARAAVMFAPPTRERVRDAQRRFSGDGSGG